MRRGLRGSLKGSMFRTKVRWFALCNLCSMPSSGSDQEDGECGANRLVSVAGGRWLSKLSWGDCPLLAQVTGWMRWWVFCLWAVYRCRGILVFARSMTDGGEPGGLEAYN
ncbi:hypothetical protein IE53DRAFT_241060 [Violaceomyces palustris]|uniref:Uncharacterized protein n=1 Tax=Violaceomyces palustris TaxID=1673888 RepID=A0ACD0NPE9_9BASI|nr:hypothetical protein IE53DRAFT_241060 [Violaceomyces palustris]